MTRVAITGLVSLALGLLFTKGLIYALGRAKMKQVIREQGPQAHLAKAGTLTMGGVGFFFAAPAALALTGSIGSAHVLAALGAATGCFLIGLADDLAKFRGKKTEGVKARYKIVLQIVIGCALAYYAMKYVPDAASPRLPAGWPAVSLSWLFIPFAVFVFCGTLNSVNFTDGLDGLLGGCSIIAAAAFTIYISRTCTGRERELIPLLAALAGSVAGFMWFNTHPASLFMGDTGSLYIGGILAAVAVIARGEIFLAFAGALFVAEAMSVVIQVASFRLTGKRVFRMSPIHHHFELAGWAETQVVFRFWLIAAVFSGAALIAFAK